MLKLNLNQQIWLLSLSIVLLFGPLLSVRAQSGESCRFGGGAYCAISCSPPFFSVPDELGNCTGLFSECCMLSCDLLISQEVQEHPNKYGDYTSWCSPTSSCVDTTNNYFETKEFPGGNYDCARNKNHNSICCGGFKITPNYARSQCRDIVAQGSGIENPRYYCVPSNYESASLFTHYSSGDQYCSTIDSSYKCYGDPMIVQGDVLQCSDVVDQAVGVSGFGSCREACDVFYPGHYSEGDMDCKINQGINFVCCGPNESGPLLPTTPDSSVGESSGDSSGGNQGGLPSLGVLKKLGSAEDLIARVIQTMVGLVGVLAMVMFIFGGLTWMLASGNESNVAKARKIVTWSAVGLVLVFSSYAILSFIFDTLN